MKSRRDLWRSMLRSGIYNKIEGFLHEEENRFCVLGVACEQYRIQTGIGIWSREFNSNRKIFKVDRVESVNDFPSIVYRWFGMDEVASRISSVLNGWMDGYDVFSIKAFFVYLNDIKKLSFDELAFVLDMMEQPELHEMQLQEIYDEFKNHRIDEPIDAN